MPTPWLQPQEGPPSQNHPAKQLLDSTPTQITWDIISDTPVLFSVLSLG